MSTLPTKAVVRVPGSTSNCGSGFDSLGLALRVYNTVTVERLAGAEPVAQRPGDARALSMVKETAALFARASGRPKTGFSFSIDGEVPAARGLGSSVTVIAGILAALNVVEQTGLDRKALVALASELEGHPDNASAGILGGFCVSRMDPSSGAYIGTQRFEVPGHVAFVVVSPDVELLTKESRGTLPASLPFFDAVKSVNAACYLVAAFASGNYEYLRSVSSDFIHEPYRLPRIKGARTAIEAGTAAGAWTGWLSGSGSSVLCVAEHARAGEVAAAMKAAFANSGVASEARILSADNEGLKVLS